MSFLVDGPLKNSSGYLRQVKNSFVLNNDKKSSSQNSAGLKINSASDSTPITKDESEINIKREKVESRASNSLLNSSIELSKRRSINEGLADSVKKLSSLNEEIKNEVNPLRKSDLTEEANSIISELDSYLSAEIEEDPDLQNSVTISSLTAQSGEDKFTYINVEGVSSLSDLGISSLDFNNYEATNDALTSASLILEQKEKSYASSTTSVSSAISGELSKFKAEVKVLADGDREQALKDLSESVNKSIFNFTIENTTPADTLLSLLEDDSEPTTILENVMNTLEKKKEEDSNKTSPTNSPATDKSISSYLKADDNSNNQSSISIDV